MQIEELEKKIMMSDVPTWTLYPYIDTGTITNGTPAMDLESEYICIVAYTLEGQPVWYIKPISMYEQIQQLESAGAIQPYQISPTPITVPPSYAQMIAEALENLYLETMGEPPSAYERMIEFNMNNPYSQIIVVP